MPFETIDMSQVRIGDVIWSSGMRIDVREVEAFPSYRGAEPVCWQARGPVTNHDHICQVDPWLARFIDSASNNHGRPGEHWWVTQGNRRASVCREVRA